MEMGGGDPSSTSVGQSDDTAELAAIDAEIARLVRRREELRARLTVPAVARAKADWYPDPSGRFAWRYWNGQEWTDSVARNGVTYTDPPVASSSSDPTTPAGPAISPTTRPGTQAPAWAASRSTSRAMGGTSEIDVGKLILVLGAALLIGGVAGLTVWLWSRIPAVGRLSLLGVAFVLQTVIAMRIRERLSAAAEAFAATGAATLLFAAGSVSATATWNGTIGVVVGAVGVMLLVFARFRAWVIAGHVAIAVGAIAVLVAEPWSQTALIIAVVLGFTRWIGPKVNASLRTADLDMYPQLLTATGLAALLFVPALAVDQFNTNTAGMIFVAVALVTSEIVVRSRVSRLDHQFSLIAAAVLAIGGVGWSASLWLNESHSDALVGMPMTAIVALLIWRVGRTEVEIRTELNVVAVGLAPVAARFACAPGSSKDLVIFCAGSALVGLAARRIVGKSLLLWFWVGAVIASIAATEQLPAWPRLALATVALAWAVPVTKIEELRYAAVVTSTWLVADILYRGSTSVSWWYRPDLVGVAAAVSLFVANRTQSEPWSVSVKSWKVPRYTESAAALFVVPVAELASRPTFSYLSTESKWRLVFIGLPAVAAWAVGALRRTRPNAAQVATLVAVAVVVVSRVGDESTTIQTGAWVTIGGLATIALMSLASIMKRDDLRFIASATATATVAVLLYGDLISVTWWFRPDLVGVAAASFLLVANRMQARPWSVSIGKWVVPRYWESVASLLLVPMAALASRPAFAELSTESKWRLGFATLVLVSAWVYGAVRRARPGAAQFVSLVAASVVVVSRVADDSLVVRTGAWVAIGGAFIFAALRIRRAELLVPGAVCWMAAVIGYSPPGPLEVLTGSLAAIAGLVALVARRFGRKGSIDFIPAAALALVPSALAAARAVLDATVDREQTVRIAVVLAVGAVALSVGTYKRLAALAGPAAVALVALAVSQLVVVQRHTSGWVTALIAGVILLVVGTRLEYLRSVSRRTGDFVKSLR